MICVMTRFRLSRWWHLAAIYLDYRRMRPDLSAAPGLIRHAFMLQNPLTCYTFSIWESERALRGFSNTSAHVHGVRLAHRVCCDIWSSYASIDAISKSAQSWPGEASWPTLVPHALLRNRLVQATAHPEANI
jgi:heme-degrading monooxygenase HmoA